LPLKVNKKKQILWVKSGPLFPPDTGGKIRTLNMLREISRHHEVTYLSVKPSGQALHPSESIDGYASEKIWVDKADTPRRSVKFFFELFSNVFSSKPFALTKHYSPECRELLISLDSSGRFDSIICDFLAPALHFQGHLWRTPIFLFQHNMEAQIWSRLAENHSGFIARLYFAEQSRRMFLWEERLSRLFKGVITVSAEDSLFARQRYGLTNVLGEVPPGVDTNYFAPEPMQKIDSERPILAFLGSMDWLPNVEGVCWFAKEVLPVIQCKVPNIRLRIVGRRPDPKVLKLAERNSAIEVTGTVDDVRPHLRDCMAVVVPLLSGGGTRIKILEAMALGVPVISTAVGVEGLPFTSGKHLLIANDPISIASACIHICCNMSTRKELVEQARIEVMTHYTWASAAHYFCALQNRDSI
jgi:glycosyltransferase involved in cell wall biosynthesis